jgi:hypothetical protein
MRMSNDGLKSLKDESSRAKQSTYVGENRIPRLTVGDLEGRGGWLRSNDEVACLGVSKIYQNARPGIVPSGLVPPVLVQSKQRDLRVNTLWIKM